MNTVHMGKRCVYAHIVEGRTVYVGMGFPQRPYEYRYRTERWKQAIGTNGFDVQILGWFDDEKMAAEFERQKIRDLNPLGNAVYTDHNQRNPRPRPPKVEVPHPPNLTNRGGKRPGAGRPRSDKPRCKCGKHTAHRAKLMRHRCVEATQ